MSTSTANKLEVTTYSANIGAEKPERPVWRVAGNQNMGVLIHVWEKGGEATMHSHKGSDANWVVVEGHVTFYGDGDVPLCTLGPAEGIFIPSNFKYWFENAGDARLVMIRSSAKQVQGDDREFYDGKEHERYD